MTLYRGPGGTGSATSDADTTLYQDFLNQTIAARDAALAAETAAELAETNAETAETNAETAEANAETAATNAASSASAADTSASNASSSASSASTSASAASTSATNAASSASSASSSASAASTSATSASTSATNAATSATNAANSATSASNSASTATTQATNAASSASAADTSASSASTSATNASNSASSAATSATNAASSATAAAASATAAAASAASIDPATLVRLTGDQTIGGTKTFTSTISGSITGNAGTVTNGVYTTGDQTVGGVKTFSSPVTLSAGSASAPALTTSGDTNTGIFFPAADTIAFAEGGVEAARFDSNGNLGIGTSSPNKQLSLAASTPEMQFQSTNTAVATNNSLGDLTWYSSDGSAGSTGIVAKIAAEADFNFDGSGFGPSIRFYTSGTNPVSLTEKMRLSFSGNLGLGVTPSAWGSGFKGLQINSAAALWGGSGSGGATYLSNNLYWSGSNRIYINTAAAAEYQQNSGVHSWYTAPSGTAGNAISFTQAMTLDASGNLSLGSTSNASRLDVTGPDNTGSTLFSRVYSLNRTAFLGFGFNTISANSNASGLFLEALGANPMAFSTNGTERARIDSSGNLLLGATSAEASSKFLVSGSTSTFNLMVMKDTQSATYADNHYQVFLNSSGATAGRISHTASTTVAYTTSSDYRLKNTIAPMTGALAKVALLKPCTYKWNADGSDGEGFIAHELQAVVPQCVTGEKDAVDAKGNPQYQGIDTSFLVATLTAAIQELKAEFDAYKASHP